MEKSQVIEYKNIRVLTTQQLAAAYETETKTISNNFSRNRDRYIEGKHFICLEREKKIEFVDRHQIDDSSKKAQKLYLWTEKGAFLHAKSLNTDKAWEVYDSLVENYFHKREHQISMSELPPEMQMFKQLWDMQANTYIEQKRQAEKISKIEKKQDALTETFSMPSDAEDFQKWANRCLSRIAESSKFDRGRGRSYNYACARNESYDRLKRKWNCNLNDRVARARGRALERKPGISKTELNSINKLTIIANDKSLKPVYETVIKEMMIAYCVEVA